LDPIFAMTVLLAPEEDVIDTFAQFPRTTFPLFARIRADVNPPCEAMNVPPSDECAARGVRGAFVRFRPQIAIVWPVEPVTAEWLAAVGAGQALPTASGDETTTASRTWNEWATIRRPGASGGALRTSRASPKLRARLTTTLQRPTRSPDPAWTVALRRKLELELCPGMSSAAVARLR
jgi:hypothetical protein